MTQEFSFTQLGHDLYLVWMSLAPLLLVGAILSSILHIILPPNFIRKALSGRQGVLKAVLIGVPLPLCSCGVIPTGLGLKRDGASDGATVGFLISTPQTGVDSILVSGSLLGLPFAIYKVLAAAITGILGGLITEHFTPQVSSNEDQSSQSSSCATQDRSTAAEQAGTKSSLSKALTHFDEVIEPIWLWVIIGVFASVAIQYLIPSESLSGLSGFSLFLPYLITLGISLPLYVCATASVPIAAALVAQGFPIGVALLFLMAGPATNVATLGAVLKGLGKKAFVIYLSTLIVGSMLFALSLDLLLAWKAPESILQQASHQHHFAWWEQVLAGILALIFIKYILQYLKLVLTKMTRRQSAENGQAFQEQQLAVSGLTCQGCVRRLEGALLQKKGIVACKVNEQLDELTVNSDLSLDEIKSLVKEAGYEAP